MRVILTALILGLSVAATSAPALAADDAGRDFGGNDHFVTTTERDTPQINLGVIAGGDEEQAPALQERYEKN